MLRWGLAFLFMSGACGFGESCGFAHPVIVARILLIAFAVTGGIILLIALVSGEPKRYVRVRELRAVLHDDLRNSVRSSTPAVVAPEKQRDQFVHSRGPSSTQNRRAVRPYTPPLATAKADAFPITAFAQSLQPLGSWDTLAPFAASQPHVGDGHAVAP